MFEVADIWCFCSNPNAYKCAGDVGRVSTGSLNKPYMKIGLWDQSQSPVENNNTKK